MYVIVLYAVGRYYYYFRVSGGLRGHKDNSKQAKKYRASIKEKEPKETTKGEENLEALLPKDTSDIEKGKDFDTQV